MGSGTFLPAVYPRRGKTPNWCLPLRVLSAVCFHGRGGGGGLEEVGRPGGWGAGCQEKPEGMRPSQTQHLFSRPFQREDGLPQSTQTNRLNPSSLFEQRPDKACPLESSVWPHSSMVTAEFPGPWEQAKYVLDCLGFSAFFPSADGIGCCVRVFFLSLTYLCPGFVELCLAEEGWGGRWWSGRGVFCIRSVKNAHLQFPKCHHGKAGRAVPLQGAHVHGLGSNLKSVCPCDHMAF